MRSKNKYILPFPKHTLTLAVCDPKVQTKEHAHAIDFLMDFDIPIFAATDGTVYDVKDDSSKGGMEDKYRGNKYLNYITIDHPGKEYSEYMHIARRGALVKPGDIVVAGQKIAKGIGMNGLTSAPHLHFDVVNEKLKRIPIRWKGPSPKILKMKEADDLLLNHHRYRKLLKVITKLRGA